MSCPAGPATSWAGAPVVARFRGADGADRYVTETVSALDGAPHYVAATLEQLTTVRYVPAARQAPVTIPQPTSADSTAWADPDWNEDAYT